MGSRATCLYVNPSFGILGNLMSLSRPQLSHLSNGDNKGNGFTELLELKELIHTWHLVPSTSKLLLKSKPSFLPDSLPSQYPLLSTFPPSPSLSGSSFLLAASSLKEKDRGSPYLLFPKWSPMGRGVGHRRAGFPSPPHGASAENWLLQTVGGCPRGCDSSPSQGRARLSPAPSLIPIPFPLLLSEVEEETGLPREVLARAHPIFCPGQWGEGSWATLGRGRN